MSKTKQKSIDELLEEALVPEKEQPYKVPENWVWVRSGHVAKWGSGGTPSRKRLEYYGGDIPWIKTGELNDGIVNASEETITEEGLQNSSAKIFPKGSIVIAMYGATIGKLGILGIDAATNQACAVGQPYDFLNSKYMFYYFLARRSDLIVLGKGGAQPNISQTIIKDFPFALPPLNEQKRIAKKVERLFAKIDGAKRLIEEVKESFELRRAAILDKAFKGQLSTNDPNEKSMLEIPDVITEKDLIPKEEQLYEVPKNWVWVRLGSFLPPMETRDPAKLEFENFMYVDIDSIDNNKFEIREPKIIEIENAPSRAKRRIDKGDVIISLVRPYLRNVARILSNDPRLVASTAFYVCKSNTITETNYLYYYLITSFVTNYLNARTKGHNAPSVRKSDFLEIPIPIPPIEEQKRIADKLNNFFNNLEIKQELVLEVEQKLDLIKQSILNKAFRGELGTNDPTDEHAIELLKEVLKSK